jgi:hypothetical protein
MMGRNSPNADCGLRNGKSAGGLFLGFSGSLGDDKKRSPPMGHPLSLTFGLWGFHSAIRVPQSAFSDLLLAPDLLPAGCDDHSNDDQPGNHEANASSYAERVQHREQKHEKEPRSPQTGHVGSPTAD